MISIDYWTHPQRCEETHVEVVIGEEHKHVFDVFVTDFHCLLALAA